MDINLTKPIEVLPAMSGGFCVRHLAELRDTAFEPPEINFIPNVDILASHDKEWESYRRLFEAAPKMLALLKYNLQWCQSLDKAEEIKALIAEIECPEKCSYCGVIGDNGRCQIPQTAEIDIGATMDWREQGRAYEVTDNRGGVVTLRKL